MEILDPTQTPTQGHAQLPGLPESRQQWPNEALLAYRRALAELAVSAPLAIALELSLEIAEEGLGRAKRVDLDRVIDHEIDRNLRVDLLRVAAKFLDRVAHRREIAQSGLSVATSRISTDLRSRS